MLFYSKGKGLSENLGFYLDTLEKEKISVSGDIFIMDVVQLLHDDLRTQGTADP